MTESLIVVRYWAAARTAAGVGQDELATDGPLTLAEVVRRAVAAHPGTRLPGVLEICSVLVGDRTPSDARYRVDSPQALRAWLSDAAARLPPRKEIPA